jgi:hypothetical protein
LRRHAKPVERTAPGRHADHDREFWLGNQIDAAAGVSEHFFDLKQIRFRVRHEHGRDSLGDLSGIARSLGDEKGVSLVESKRMTAKMAPVGWETLGLAAADGSGPASAI